LAAGKDICLKQYRKLAIGVASCRQYSCTIAVVTLKFSRKIAPSETFAYRYEYIVGRLIGNAVLLLRPAVERRHRFFLINSDGEMVSPTKALF